MSSTARLIRNLGRFAVHRRWELLSRPLIAALRAKVQRRHLAPGVTVLIANWRTSVFLQSTVSQVLRCSPPGTRIVVVDNASTNESRKACRALPSSVKVISLPVNVGHGVALDLAATWASTEFIVALDVDAFPIDHRWIERLERPLRQGARVSGAGGSMGHIAPCCLMISLERFVEQRHTFTSRFVPGNEPRLRPERVWDVGRLISLREGPDALHRFERTAYLDEDKRVGEIFDELVYHNGYATVDRVPRHRGTVTEGDALSTWRLALERFHVEPSS